MSFALRTWPHHTSNFISRWILPVGYFCLLTGLTWLDDRSQYHKLFYTLIAAPALIAMVMQPKQLAALLSDPVTLAFLAFAAWSLLSISWSDTDESVGSLAKRPLYILTLFIACTLMAQRNCSRLLAALYLASLVIVLIALYALADFARHYTPGARLIGNGALDNPLLSSHLFGLFCVIWLSWVMAASNRQSQRTLLPLTVLSITLLATGSRTPILAMAFSSVWLMLCCWSKRAFLLAILNACGVLALLLIYPESLLNRGTSYRPEIWQLALEQIRLQPWIGHGFDAHLTIYIPSINYVLSEPHSFFIGVLYYTGAIGAFFWLLMHGVALWTCWQRRSDVYFIIAGALVVYGLGAGLTEGGGILSRPKEHWFLTWIPLALVTALNIGRKSGAKPLIQHLSAEQLQALMRDSTVLEQDGLGPKVLRLQDGSFLKLFRKRRLFSSETLKPYAKRFADNAKHLQHLGVNAPQIIATYRVEDAVNGTAVHYLPLPGDTLRQTLENAEPEYQRQLILQFGQLLGRLHEQGVYFRSIHLGNVLVLPNAALGLIDVADMTIGHRPLSLHMRQRNLKHMRRYKKDEHWLFSLHKEALSEGYSQHALRYAQALLKSD